MSVQALLRQPGGSGSMAHVRQAVVALVAAIAVAACGEGAIDARGDAVLVQDTGGNGSLFDVGNPADGSSASDASNPGDAGLPGDAGHPGDTAIADSGGADTNVEPGDAGTGDCATSCDDGIPCTVDVCKAGTCTHNIAPGSCYADGACYAAGPHPTDACRLCDPTKSPLGLQPSAAGKACDDGSSCTINDACDGSGACIGAPAPGCCKADSDCVSTDPCVAAICDVGSGACKSAAKAGCCKGGICCNVGTGAIQPAGTVCSQVAIAAEFACDGKQIRRREQLPGCDGQSAEGCSNSPATGVWGPWQTVQTCSGSEACVPAPAGQQPSCGVPPECVGASDCNDGNLCTKDSCTKGACVHAPEAAGVPCGNTVLATEYQCSSGDPGGKILARKAISTCDGVATACPETTKTPYWGPWAPIQTCSFAEVCKVSDPTKPGVCTGAPKCKPGTTCCDADGNYAAKGTACADKVVDTESKCVGAPPGNKIQSRSAKPGCSGSSTTCFEFSSSYWVWSDWQDVKTCGAKESCEIGWNGTGGCTTKTQCSPTSGCCTADGFYQPQGSVCSTSSSAAKTEKKCESTAKGGWILQRSSSYGCSGSSGSCSYSSADYVPGEWKQLEQCAKNEACDDSFGYVYCTSVGVCSPSSGCCTEDGDYAAAGGKCKTSSSPWETERKCDGTQILVRKGWAGCDGKSSGCSYSSASLVWDEWALEKDCGPSQTCKGSGSFLYCGTP